jgi:hypothetical protein
LFDLFSVNPLLTRSQAKQTGLSTKQVAHDSSVIVFLAFLSPKYIYKRQNRSNREKRGGEMKRFAFLIVAAFLLSGLSTQAGKSESVTPEQAKGCLSCHEGIESIRQETSPMMLAIKGIGSVPTAASCAMAAIRGRPPSRTRTAAARKR